MHVSAAVVEVHPHSLVIGRHSLVPKAYHGLKQWADSPFEDLWVEFALLICHFMIFYRLIMTPIKGVSNIGL